MIVSSSNTNNKDNNNHDSYDDDNHSDDNGRTKITITTASVIEITNDNRETVTSSASLWLPWPSIKALTGAAALSLQ